MEASLANGSRAELETAVVLVLAEAAPQLSALHAEHYPEAVAKQIPLHITLLSPFVARAALTGTVVSALRRFFVERPPPAFALTRLDEFPGVIYAAPEPAEELVELIEALSRAFPETPPYGGAYAEPVPHASLAEVPADSDQELVAAKLRRAAEPLLPVQCEIPHASLLEEQAPGRWRVAERFPFAGRGAD
jgi:2'-5' RNA ligase